MNWRRMLLLGATLGLTIAMLASGMALLPRGTAHVGNPSSSAVATPPSTPGSPASRGSGPAPLEAIPASVPPGILGPAVVQTLNPYNGSMLPGNQLVQGQSYPYTAVVDTGVGAVFVADEGSGSVSVISTSTHAVLATIAVGANPSSLAYDNQTGEVYVANSGSNTVSVVSDTTYGVLATIPVPANPTRVAFDPHASEVFVAASSTDNVTVISAATHTVVASIGVAGPAGCSLAVDPVLGQVFDVGVNETYVISDAVNQQVASVPAGDCASYLPTAGYDPLHGEMLLADYNTSSVLVVQDGNADAPLPPINVSGAPTGLLVANGGLFVYVVTITGPGTVDTIGTANNTVFASVTVGYYSYALAGSLSSKAVVVVGYSGRSTVVEAGSIVATVPTDYDALTGFGDPASQEVYLLSYYGIVDVMSNITYQVTAHIVLDLLPAAMVDDPGTSKIFLLYSGLNELLVRSSVTGALLAELPTGNYPGMLALDPVSEVVVVASYYPHALTFFSATNDTVLGNLSLPGYVLYGLLADSGAGQLFVEQYQCTGYPTYTCGGLVSIVSLPQRTFLANLTLSPDVYVSGRAVYDPADSEVFVLNYGPNASVFSDVNDTLVATVPLAAAGSSLVYVASTDEVWVSESPTSVEIINGATNTVVGGITAGVYPEWMTYDPAVGEVFVVSTGTGTISVFGAQNRTLLASILAPALQAPVLNAATGDLYVLDGAAPLLVISDRANAVVAKVAVGPYAEFAAYDPGSATVLVEDGGGGISFVRTTMLYTVTVHAAGLVPGQAWSVITVGATNLTRSAVVPTSGHSAVVLHVPAGTFRYAFVAPSGYGVAKVTGNHRAASYASTAISGRTTLRVHFGQLEEVNFSEARSSRWPGLPAGSVWSVTLTPHGNGEDPTVLTASTNGTSVAFLLPHGAHYRYVVTQRADYHAHPAQGPLGVPAHAVGKSVKFRPFTGKVAFEDTTFTSGTLWYVNLTGPQNLSLGGSTSALVAKLTVGTYSYTYQRAGGPIGTGTLTVVSGTKTTVLLAPPT